ncbi:type VII secretion system-associated protein [Streptomyces sp. NPDC005494]|uniref:type VII secretion system-associated protein n=1 Tax=Streptomyces sp. NPDC005494 TaxID=3364715 RepID=UPI0036C37240
MAAARTAPEHWLSVTDRHWLGGTDGEPAPPWAVLGRWRSDAHGEIVEWETNQDYRPSPAALGWAPPVSDADAALHLAATGYGPDADVAEALAEAGEVAVCVDADGEPTWTRAPGGAHAVPVFPVAGRTHPDRLPAHVVMALPVLLDRLPPGRDVMLLSPSAPAALLVPAGDLRALREAAAGDTRALREAAAGDLRALREAAVDDTRAPRETSAGGPPARHQARAGRRDSDSGIPSERGQDE